MLLVLLCFGTVASAAEVTALGLRFARSGTDAASVTVSVVDQDGTAISGATASMTTSHAFKATNKNNTSSILCPNANGTSSPTIVLTFNVSGLPTGFSYNNVGMDIHALNGSDVYQQNGDGQKRQWNVAVKQGASSSALSDFALLSNIDIAEGVGTSGNVHKVWDATSTTTATAGTTLSLQLTITKGTVNGGCFFGLSEITLSTGEAPEIPDPEPAVDPIDPTACYYIQWSQNAALYMAENASGGVVVTGEDITQKQFWQFEATAKENCFYVKNLASGKYLQSCNKENSNQSLISVGDTPVEYYVVPASSGSGVAGFWRLTSTDCPNYATSSSNPHALNKDGASTNVIVWGGQESNVGSWWGLVKTENLYDLQPFGFSEVLGKEREIYAVVSATTGKVLEMAADGALSWADRTFADNQTWYFVGTGNKNGGFLIANLGTGQTIDLDSEDQTRWYVLEGTSDKGGYELRPFATKDDAATALTIAEEKAVLFKSTPSSFARSAQIYALPCGETNGVYVANAAISGANKPMTYPLATLNGTTVDQPAAAAPSMWYTIYSHDKAIVARGSKFNLSISLNKAPLTGQVAYVYFDWDRDGIFETMHTFDTAQQMQAEISVPAEAEAGESRMRFRLTANGLEDAEDCVTGQIVDFLIQVEEQPGAAWTCSVSVNDPLRGVAFSHGPEAGSTERTVEAKANGDATFLCWKEAKNVVSAQALHTFTIDHNTHLTAFFTPITTDIPTGIDLGVLKEENLLLNVKAERSSLKVETPAEVRLLLVYTPDGALVGRSTTSELVFSTPLEAGTYIVKAFTADSDKVCKAYIK